MHIIIIIRLNIELLIARSSMQWDTFRLISI